MTNPKIKALFKKEFIQTLRDKRMIFVLFGGPMVQIILFGFAVTTDIIHTKTVISTAENSYYSREFIKTLSQGDYFDINAVYNNDKDAYNYFIKNKQTLLVNIPPKFEKDILIGKNTTIQLIVDGSDTMAATVAAGYVANALRHFTESISTHAGSLKNNSAGNLEIKTRFLYNPDLKSSTYMVPGILVTILTLITTLLTSMAITREREVGTLEQIIVSPIKPNELILGKTLPFVVFGCIDATLILSFGILLFKVPFVGPVWVMALAALAYVFTCIGIGVVISTFSKTQQQAMLTFFFYMFPAITLSGFIFPIENMPQIFQYITLLNPMRYFIQCIRGIMLKGDGFFEILPWLSALILMATTMLSLGIFRFRKKWL